MHEEDAVALWTVLSRAHFENEEADGEPQFDVRLDAITTIDEERDYRVRVSLSRTLDCAAPSLIELMVAQITEVLGESADITFANDGLEVRA